MNRKLTETTGLIIVEITDPLFAHSLWVCKDEWDEFYLSGDKAKATALTDREINAFLLINPSYEIEHYSSTDMPNHTGGLDRMLVGVCPQMSPVLVAAELLGMSAREFEHDVPSNSRRYGWDEIEGGLAN